MSTSNYIELGEDSLIILEYLLPRQTLESEVGIIQETNLHDQVIYNQDLV